MSDLTKSLELNQGQLDVLAAALQTQIKILSMEVQAGTTSAKPRLNDVKGMLAQIDALRCPTQRKPMRFGWLQQSLRMS